MPCERQVIFDALRGLRVNGVTPLLAAFARDLILLGLQDFLPFGVALHHLGGSGGFLRGFAFGQPNPLASQVSGLDLKGGLLYAKYGKGVYIYNAYAFYRQLPEGVPGAYRLFANIISLGKNPQLLAASSATSANR